jgi:2-polyprenyl-6-methoxyphenol hydroxylase-like FAD-dependent oxidoreductase
VKAMKKYDAIIVGARCAGSPAAMLLARRGHRVLVVDRATFPSDTISTHLLQPMAIAALSRWGLLERLTATGCPPIHTYAFDFGPLTISGAPGNAAAPLAYCPRRTILDKLLVDAAAEAGAEIREAFKVEELLIEDGRVTGIKGHTKGGATVVERAEVVIGADGKHSLVAEAAGAERYHEKPSILAAYYAYFSGLPMDGRFEIYNRTHRGFAAAETHDGLTLVIGGWPYAEFERNKHDAERHLLEALELAPAFADRVRRAKRESKLAGAALTNFFRKPFGPGWALVGDAGYHKDSITAQGMKDAFVDAERCAAALHDVFTGARTFEDAMGDYQRARDAEALPMYELTCQVATLEPPPPEMAQLLASIQGDQQAMDAFVQMNAGTIPPSEFFERANRFTPAAAANHR